MGIAKRQWMEQQQEEYEEELAQWVRDKIGDDEADESHPRWQELADRYRSGEVSYFDYADEWDVPGKSRIELFDESMSAVREMLGVQVSSTTQRSLHVMLYAHVVAATEGFLASTFIATTLSSKIHIQALVESDPEFANRKLTVKEIFSKQAGLKDEIGIYLKALIFHNIEKVKPMYRDVFKIDFGEIGWLVKGVKVRHDCVHRAGYDKDGNDVNLSADDVLALTAECEKLVHKVDTEIAALPRANL